MRSLIVGFGEVGRAHYEVLQEAHDVQWIDKDPKHIEPLIDIMHIALPSPTSVEEWLDVVWEYVYKYTPRIVNVLTTVPPGVTRRVKASAVHSTTRGLHPQLESGLRNIPKHIGGPMASEVARYFSRSGIICYTHKRAETTELLHLLNNLHYGVNLMYADEAARVCRQFGVDYTEYMLYTKTNNIGFEALDHASKVRPILTPPGGKIGGHCVVPNAKMLAPSLKDAPLIQLLAKYNDAKT